MRSSSRAYSSSSQRPLAERALEHLALAVGAAAAVGEQVALDADDPRQHLAAPLVVGVGGLDHAHEGRRDEVGRILRLPAPPRRVGDDAPDVPAVQQLERDRVVLRAAEQFGIRRFGSHICFTSEPRAM